MADPAELLRTERLALVELLESLDEAQWSTHSLCSGWTVQDVAAHLAWAPSPPPIDVATGLVRAGLGLNRFIEQSAVRYARRGREVILDRLREIAVSGDKPLGMPPGAVMTDAVVHPLDIGVPLGVHRPIPRDAFVVAADFNVERSWFFSLPIRGRGPALVRGLRLVCPEVDWVHGSGPDLEGPAEAIVLLLTGRPYDAAAFRGPGAAVLASRR